MSDKLERLRALAEELTSYEADRKKSLKRLSAAHSPLFSTSRR